MEAEELLDSLRRAVEHQPDDPVLRQHLAELLTRAGHGQEAVAHVGFLLANQPDRAELHELMSRALGKQGSRRSQAGERPAGASTSASPQEDFDWGAAEEDLQAGLAHDPVETRLRLVDVAGLDAAKERIEVGFLTPLRNPGLRAKYGKSLRGGLLLYGPPGCGKTHLARAIAGELGARFIEVSLPDVLSRWVGGSETNVAEIFGYARSQAPCVVFLDEVDALGHSRSRLGASGAALRGVVNQLLTELDGVGTNNEGVFLLGATNAPWDVDLALRRPGRFDRAVFVEPPDAAARAQILAASLSGLPAQAGIDLVAVAAQARGFSGADLAHVAQSATEIALADAVRTGAEDREITAADLTRALTGITPSTGRWFSAARNVVLFGDDAGEFSALADYMRTNRLL